MIHTILPVAQIVISVILIILILLQERSSGLSGLFGGGDGGGGYYQARRGLERVVFISTIILIAVFLALAVLQLIY